jgi:SAM-dependent methyltransferase
MSSGRANVVTIEASSTGQFGTGAGWLDVHFEACRAEYEAMVRSVGIQPGWRVLDAGCGGGAFLPLLAELVGPTGAIAALDIAPDNVAKIEQLAADWGLVTPIEARVGSMLDLPYEDDAFDAVWCANVVGYLTDDGLGRALAEFRRVVRPGGLIGIKEYDGTMQRILPAPPYAISHLLDLDAGSGVTRSIGVVAAPSLAARLRRAGLIGVWMRTILAERCAPLALPERQFWGAVMDYFAPLGLEHPVPTEDRAFWERMNNPAERERWLDDPDLVCCEGQIIAVGTVPQTVDCV